MIISFVFEPDIFGMPTVSSYLGLTEYFGCLNNLQLAHGADPTMKNQEGQTALDLATVKS